MDLVLRAPITTALVRLATPNVIAACLMTAVTVADAWFVGQFGTVALASLAVVFPFQTLMQMMAGGAIGGGVTSAVARALGRGDADGASSAAWHALLIAAAMSLLFMLALGAFAHPVFALIGARGEALAGAVEYAQIAFGGAAATWLTFVTSAILRGTGDTATPSKAITLGSFAQVALSGVLTLGAGPVTAQGVVGPAMAMVTVQGSIGLFLLAYIFAGKTPVRLAKQSFRVASIKDIMRVGAIGLVNSLSIAATVVVVTALVARHGTAALAGYGLGSRLELMLVPIAFGIGGALTAAVGLNFGAGQYARARRIAWLGGGATFAATATIGGVFALWPHLWLDRFTADPAAYAVGTHYLWIVGPFYGLFAAGQTLYFASQGTGRMGLPVTVGVARFVVVAGLAALLTASALPVGWLFGAVALGLVIVGAGLSACVALSGPWNPDRP